jgi:hypothetical protein
MAELLLIYRKNKPGKKGMYENLVCGIGSSILLWWRKSIDDAV